MVTRICDFGVMYVAIVYISTEERLMFYIDQGLCLVWFLTCLLLLLSRICSWVSRRTSSRGFLQYIMLQ